MSRKLVVVFLLSLFFLISSASAANETVEVENTNIEDEELIISDNNQNITTGENIKKNPNLRINVTNNTPGGSAVIEVSANPNATGNVTLTVSTFIYNLELINGSAKQVVNLNPGVYSIGLTYSGDENFRPFSQYEVLMYLNYLIISDFYTTIVPNYENMVIYYRNGTQFKVTVFDSKGNPINTSPGIQHQMRFVNITVNGVTYQKILDENGEVSLNINLNPGTYEIFTEFMGDYIYPPQVHPKANITTNLTVLPTIQGKDITKIFRNGTQYTVKVVDGRGNPLANEEVEFNINGVIYKRMTNANGEATLNINLNPGKYIVTATAPNGEKISNNITVLSNMIKSQMEMSGSHGFGLYFTALNDEGNPAGAGEIVTVNVNGRIYEYRSDENGSVDVVIDDLEAGNYIITVEYNGLKYSYHRSINIFAADKKEDFEMDLSVISYSVA